MQNMKEVINEQNINKILEKTISPSPDVVKKILEKALKKEGLTLQETGYLLNTEDEKLIEEMFQTSNKIKDEIYGERLVLFAPFYVSNFCVNDCKYCGFHCSNPEKRKKLTLEEVKDQVKILERMGHKRLLLEFGEDPAENPINYIVDVIKTIYNTKVGNGEIRRVNVNIAAATVEDYKKLKEAGIGTYQLFQETYHQETYKEVHKGPKSDYERQLFAHDRAMQAGLNDVGLGVLFGLYNYKFEVLALLSHSEYLEKKYNVGPHTISVPRFQPAATVNTNFPHEVSEDQLLKIISILRMAVPYTGLIITTREKPETRAKAFDIGISQTSAASSTSPGGYGKEKALEQFSLQDSRDMDQILKSILNQNLLPSYCTACYRLNRTGETIMKLIKTGKIHELCRPNAILTFKEYLEDYASQDVKELGVKVIQKYLEKISDDQIKKKTLAKLKRIENGERDLYF
ncbi:MAG: [FeFe] hydrogenase H-cluster radical SAM maturase HydG [Nanoarchaeota archaeon]|nr:[FeFe] hydrogenase H-cluster radical SAM maturase HydG [Nanoarchaeota archaeon]